MLGAFIGSSALPSSRSRWRSARQCEAVYLGSFRGLSQPILPSFWGSFRGLSRPYFSGLEMNAKTPMTIEDNARGVFTDKRQTFAGRVAALTKSLTDDLGEEVSQTERSLISLAATLTARAEVLQAALLRGEPVDDDTIVRVNNAAARMLDKIADIKKRRGSKPRVSRCTRESGE
jgi:hypothetical protein